MKRYIHILYICLLSSALAGCNKEMHTPYDNPFFYTHVNQSSSVNVQATRNETIDYKVYFSAKLQYDPITLNYELIVGDGLIEGKDFEVLSPKNVIVFKPGYFEMPITIKWIANAIDATKDNSLTIRLLNNDKNIIIGLPGPDKNQSELKINKI